MAIPLELKQVFGDAQDDPISSDPEVPDAFSKFFEDAQLAAALGGRSAHQHVANFREETSGIDAALTTHYKKLAAAEGEKKTLRASSDELKKRFGGAEKTVFRKFFAERKAAGDTIAQILDKFTDQARREFSDTLRELAEEFA